MLLTCDVSGNPEPSLEWFYGETPISEMATRRIRVIGDRLRIRRIKLGDAGSYTCVATNAVSTATREIEVTVTSELNTRFSFVRSGIKRVLLPTAQPSIGRVIDTVALRSDAIYLHCPTSGNPPPDVTWIKDGEVIGLPSLRYVFFSNNGTLKILSAERADSGGYSCRAENVRGAAEKKLTVTVYGNFSLSNSISPFQSHNIRSFAVPATISSGPADTKARVGDNVVFQCAVTGTPVPRILWLVDPSLRTSSRIEQRTDGSLVLRDVRPSDAGIFTCLARNDVGEVTDSAKLTVLGKTGIQKERDSSPQIVFLLFVLQLLLLSALWLV